ncbi:MAG: hypothetical protein CM1200mP2_13030 [Planctomycetaceae bacterium]|nr:MAG: hypothetical protein CM1200mP2_13030 [Planctomycetaceae bacterium]
MTARFDLESVRSQFPAFNRTVEGHPVVFLDGAAGSQVPSRVAEAVKRLPYWHQRQSRWPVCYQRRK